MNDSIVCEKCNYDLFMICPDGLTVCNHCGEFSSFSTHPPIAPPAIPTDLRGKVLELCELTLINGGPAGMVTAAMMQRAKAIREMMGEA